MNTFSVELAFRSSMEGKLNRNFDFVAVFNCFVLEAQKELDNVLGFYDYVLVEIRSFPGSFVP